MKTYKVHLSKKSRKILSKGDPTKTKRLRESLERLANEPHLGKRLAGQFRGSYSWRAGNWRIIYSIDNDDIIVERIEWRDKAYR